MNRTELFSGVRVTPEFMFQLLNHASRFGSCCFLDNRGYASALHAHEFLLGFGEIASVELTAESNPEELDSFLEANKGNWIFGHFSYDFRQNLHGIDCRKPDPVGFASARLFVPAVCMKGNAEEIKLAWSAPEFDAEAFFNEVMQGPVQPAPLLPVSLNPIIDQNQYIGIIEKPGPIYFVAIATK